MVRLVQGYEQKISIECGVQSMLVRGEKKALTPRDDSC